MTPKQIALSAYERGVRDADQLARMFLIGRPPAAEAYRESIAKLLAATREGAETAPDSQCRVSVTAPRGGKKI